MIDYALDMTFVPLLGIEEGCLVGLVGYGLRTKLEIETTLSVWH